MPAPIRSLVAQLAALDGAVAVVLGGSRATGVHRPDSDWDLGLYYRGRFDPGALRALGHPGYVSALGEWGPIVHGGAWLTVGGLPVDVLFRDLDVVEPWTEDARQGRFDVLAQSGHVVGAPTYLPMGELALSRPLAGEELARPAFPRALATAAPTRWESRASVALMFAESHARARDVAPCAGMLASAVLCGAHARLAARNEWALNEKRLVTRAGLEDAEPVLAAVGLDPVRAVQDVSALLRIQPLAIR